MAKAKEQTSEKAPKCPISRDQFKKAAKPILAVIGEQKLVANVKPEMSTGSFGWHVSDKITMEVDGVPVRVQCNIGLTVIGSKELPK